ncbi:hypothetical protein BKN49_20640 [Pseudomonas aeruginosa]|nr:hypothetical protein BKN49_20640 [Pseudomonas aeruginosa]
MYQTQRARLTAHPGFKLTPEQGNAILARAYAHESYDSLDDKLIGPIQGLQPISKPSELLTKDPSQQLTEFVRMATNLSIPGLPNVTGGRDPRALVACMYNFTNFDALIAYARSEPVDPHSADPTMLAKFERRHGIKAPGEYLFGRGYDRHTYVLRQDKETFEHFIDQELSLTNLSGLQVVVVRTNPMGDRRLSGLVRDLVVLKGPLQEHQSSLILGARKSDSHIAVSLIPDVEYTLEQLVAAHLASLSRDAAGGRTLILDGVRLAGDDESLQAGLKLAALRKINLVIAQDAPDVRLWNMAEARLIFSVDRAMSGEGSLELTLALTQASTYLSRASNKLLYIYHTDREGVRFTAMDLVSGNVSRNIISRVFGAPRG